MIVFIVSGLWHGANYTFIIWGAIHGIMLVFEKQVYGKRLKLIKPGVNGSNILKWIITYSVVVLAWVFFRANNLHDAFYVLQHFFDFNKSDFLLLLQSGGAFQLLGVPTYDFYLGIFFIGVSIVINFLVRKNGLVSTVRSLPVFYRYSLYIVFSIVILWFGKFGLNQFIYFQF
jgi:hypothetical protein